MNIYICNLSSVIGNEDLTEIFSIYGEVTSAEIVNDIFTGESRGFGYIDMEDSAGQRAIEGLDQTELDTLIISVQENR